MGNNIDKAELVERIAKRLATDTDAVEQVVDATLEEIYQALKREESVSLRASERFSFRYGIPGRSSSLIQASVSKRYSAGHPAIEGNYDAYQSRLGAIA